MQSSNSTTRVRLSNSLSSNSLSWHTSSFKIRSTPCYLLAVEPKEEWLYLRKARLNKAFHGASQSLLPRHEKAKTQKSMEIVDPLQTAIEKQASHRFCKAGDHVGSSMTDRTYIDLSSVILLFFSFDTISSIFPLLHIARWIFLVPLRHCRRDFSSLLTSFARLTSFATF